MPVPIPPYPVPSGPLVARFLVYELPPVRAGAVTVVSAEVENAGTAAWEVATPISLAYHWLDRYGNVLVWDGPRTPLPAEVQPGGRVVAWSQVRAPMPPGPYRLVLDLVAEGRGWFAELGNRPLELEVEVVPRLATRALAVEVEPGVAELEALTQEALAAQEEPLVGAADALAVARLAAGCMPAPDWSRRVLDAHAEGNAAVAGSIELRGGLRARRAARALEHWAPGFGRAPSWSRELVCPSILRELADHPWAVPVAGLPALDPSRLAEPWLCDGRIRVAVDPRALARRNG